MPVYFATMSFSKISGLVIIVLIFIEHMKSVLSNFCIMYRIEFPHFLGENQHDNIFDCLLFWVFSQSTYWLTLNSVFFIL